MKVSSMSKFHSESFSQSLTYLKTEWDRATNTCLEDVPFFQGFTELTSHICRQNGSRLVVREPDRDRPGEKGQTEHLFSTKIWSTGLK
jgi:hypothetical protein